MGSDQADSRQLQDDRDLQQIVDFWSQYGYLKTTRQNLEAVIRKHQEYKTLEVLRVAGKIVGVCRYNLYGVECHVLDCLIHTDYRSKRIIKLMALRGFRKFPLTTVLVFVRDLKDNRTRRLDFMKFMGIKHG